MAKTKKNKRKKVSRGLKDLKNINLLKEQIQDEMSWLEEHFLEMRNPWFIVWRNTHAEERFNNLQLRLEALN